MVVSLETGVNRRHECGIVTRDWCGRHTCVLISQHVYMSLDVALLRPEGIGRQIFMCLHIATHIHVS